MGQQLGGGQTQSRLMLCYVYAWAKAYISSGILVHPAVWPQQTQAKNWGCTPSAEGEMGPHLTQCRLG